MVYGSMANDVNIKLAAGVDLENASALSEGYEMQKDGTVLAFASIDKIQDVINFYLASLNDKGNKVVIFIEVPCTADEEDELTESSPNHLHRKVYYSIPLDPGLTMAVFDRHKDLLLNDGLITFGFFSEKANSHFSCDGYKVMALDGCTPDDLESIFELANVPDKAPITPWDLISPDNPGSRIRAEYEGKDIDDAIEVMSEECGLTCERVKKEKERAIRIL